MFQVKDFVVYGNHGICSVEAIGPIDLKSADRNRLYYTLKPLYVQGIIYTPVDNEKAPIRRALNPQEAWELIDRIPEIETVWVCDDKQREETFKELMRDNQCDGWVRIIKTLYLKKQRRLAEGKKSTERDEFYLKLAENLLYGELAAALQVDKSEVVSIINKRVKETQEIC